MGDRILEKTNQGILPKWLFILLVILSAFVFLAALLLSYKLFELPKFAALDCLRLIRASLFSYGLALGLLGSSAALHAPLNRRGYGVAATIHGFGFMLLAFVTEHTLKQGAMHFTVPIAPMILPCAILVISIVVFRRTWLKEKAQQHQEVSSAEVPQPLSLP